MRRLFLVVAASLIAGCSKDDTTLSPVAGATTAAPTTMSSTPPAPTSSAPPAVTATYDGALDLEIISAATAHLAEHADGSLDVTLDLARGGGVFEAPKKLAATGKTSRFPEADTVIYTARFASPAFKDGRCGSQPVSLALSLKRVGQNDRVSGGLTAYCGKDVWFGAPALVLRITGALPHSGP